MNLVNVGPIEVAASLTLIAVAVLLSWRERLGIGRSIVWAATRAVLQMLVIGAALGLVFAKDAPLVWSWLWVIAMVTVGATTVATRVRGTRGVFLITWLALAVAVGISLVVVFGFAIFPLEARTLVPTAGMLMGNAIGATVLAVRRTTTEVREHRDEIEVRLALGQTGRAALRPHLADAMRTSITPQIEQTKIVGLIALPGTMTGLLLAGVDPVDAVLTQTIVMFLILGSVAVTSVIVGRGIAGRLVTPDHRLVAG
ncbi:MAG: iron export ABC transporter permease subunit FetB [Microthrixaceae bacterium]